MTLIFLNSLRILWPRIWFILVNVLCALEKECVFCSRLSGMLYICQLFHIGCKIVQLFYVLVDFLPIDSINYLEKIILIYLFLFEV